MATNMELKQYQNTLLFKLLKLKKLNKGVKITGLAEMVLEVKASMSQEEVAYVEKLVEEI